MGKWLDRFAEKNITKTSGIGTDKNEIDSSLAVIPTRGTIQTKNPKTPTLAEEPEQNYTVAGKVVQLHRMRDSCQDIGHCLALTQETDCNLYPVKIGWCRKRI